MEKNIFWKPVMPKKWPRLISISFALFALSCSPENADETQIPDPDDPGSPDMELLSESLMMDIVFDQDGTAKDISDNANNVVSVMGSTVLVYYNNSFGGYIPRFYNTPGESVSSGYYRAEYYTDRSFRTNIQNGFTLETMFMLESEPDGSKMAVFSSLEDGGAGLSIAANTMGNEIIFELYVGSRLVTLRSGVAPEKGKAYHVAGVWDKEGSTAYLYVNGELKASFGTSGDFVLPELADQWFGIGCDAGPTSGGEYSFRGDIYIARVYGLAADSGQISSLWADADRDLESSFLSIDDILIFPSCEVCPGYRYMILGTGFQQGDMVRLAAADDADNPVDLQCEVYAGHVTLIMPSGIKDGNYSLYIVRDGVIAPLGIVRLVLSDNPAPLSAPGIVAHRGYHILPGTVENSISALEAAQELGVYGCEIDVWITADDTLVVHHDGVMSGMTFQNCNWDDIKDLRLSNSETLPLLSDMLELVKEKGNTKLIIEIKEHSSQDRNEKATDEVLDMVADMETGDYVEYISSDMDICRRIAEKSAGAMVGYLGGDVDPATLAADGIMCIDYPYATLNALNYMVKDAHDLGMKVNIWTINDDSEMMSSIALGVDYITTDYPDRLAEICEMMRE